MPVWARPLTAAAEVEGDDEPGSPLDCEWNRLISVEVILFPSMHCMNSLATKAADPLAGFIEPSLMQKKRIWYRNSAINLILIAAWVASELEWRWS